MSWDIVLFSTKQKIDNLEEVDDSQFVPVDFNGAFVRHFPDISDMREGAREIIGAGFSIVFYGEDGELEGNTMVNLYGERALFEMVILARENNWQIYDTGIGEMLDLDHPERNGYENFQEYLRHVLKR